MKFFHLSLAPVALAILATSTSAHADTVNWATWSTSTTANTATGTIGSIGVTYSGQLLSVQGGYPSWTPSSSYVGGTVGNAPPAANNAVQMTGGTGLTETITFTSAVVDPYLAIWSLGSGGNPASFVFNSSEPFTIESGGPSIEYGGTGLGSITNGVTGSEGNGIIQFSGTYTSITFTTPQYENYYDFTVGNDATAAATPEPGSLSLLGLGIAALPMMRRKFLGKR